MSKFYEPSHDFITSDGVRINFVDVQEGNTVDGNVNANDEKDETQLSSKDPNTIVLVHGLMCSSKMWQPPYGPRQFLDSLLKKGYRVVALDCRGHGTSDKPKSSYGRRMVQDLVELLDHLSIHKVYSLIGYSMGAEIGLFFAIQHPTRLGSLCMGGSGWSHGTDWYTKKAYGSFVNPKTLVGCLFHALSMVWYPCCCCWIGPCLNGDAFDRGAFFGICEGMKDILQVSREDLEALQVPVLGISGECDEELEYLQRIQGVIPKYRLVVIPNKNHETALGDPMFQTSVLDFLQDTEKAIQIS